jgi:predicted DsbA family dithiol-disulfide isomerase
VRALTVEFGGELEWTFVMGGLARELPSEGLVRPWLDAAGESGMPTDPRAWFEGPIGSTYPACMAVKAAQEQGADAGRRYLRALREGIVALRRKLDTTEALVEEARGAGLDAERFRIDLSSHAIVEAFGKDLDEAREVPEAVADADAARCSQPMGVERVPLPTFGFAGDGQDEPTWVFGSTPHGALREAAVAAGARPGNGARPGVMEALERFGRMALPEVAAVCDMPAPRAEAELAQLALDWRVRPIPVLSDRLWEPA